MNALSQSSQHHSFSRCLPPRSTLCAAAVIAGIVLLAIPAWRDTGSTPTHTTTAGLSCGPAALIEAAANLNPCIAAQVRTVLDDDPRASRPVTSFHDLATWSEAAGLGIARMLTGATPDALAAAIGVDAWADAVGFGDSSMHMWSHQCTDLMTDLAAAAIAFHRGVERYNETQDTDVTINALKSAKRAYARYKRETKKADSHMMGENRETVAAPSRTRCVSAWARASMLAVRGKRLLRVDL